MDNNDELADDEIQTSIINRQLTQCVFTMGKNLGAQTDITSMQ